MYREGRSSSLALDVCWSSKHDLDDVVNETARQAKGAGGDRDSHLASLCWTSGWVSLGVVDGCRNGGLCRAVEFIRVPCRAQGNLVAQIAHHFRESTPSRGVGRTPKSKSQCDVSNVAKEDDCLSRC